MQHPSLPLRSRDKGQPMSPYTVHSTQRHRGSAAGSAVRMGRHTLEIRSRIMWPARLRHVRHRARSTHAARLHTTRVQRCPRGGCWHARQRAHARARTRELLRKQLQRGRRGHDRNHANEGRRRAARHQVVYHLRDGAACARRPKTSVHKPRPLASKRGARSRAQRAQACGRACALPRMHLGIERSYNFHRSRALTPMMPWRDMHRAAISCQPTCRARAPVASMGSVIRTRSSASRLAGSLFRYSRACAQQHGRPSAAGRPGAHLAFTSQPDRNPGMSCPTHLVGHPQGLCVAMWAQHAPHHVFTTTVGGFEYFEAAA